MPTFQRTFMKPSYFLILCISFMTSAVAYASLPNDLTNYLHKKGISEDQIAIVIADANAQGKPWIAHNANSMMHPASVMKLVTTYAALDLLGPNYTWYTGAFIDGTLKNQTLAGSLYIRGSGDPSLTADRMRELLLQIRATGIRKIQGDIIIDSSAYDIPFIDPAAFDGEPLRPYNVRPESLLVNYKTFTFSFNPSLAEAGTTIPVVMTPSMSGVRHSLEVNVDNQRCGDWQKGLQADFSDSQDIHFNGSFPLSCGPKQWFVAYPDPQNYSTRTIQALWRDLGGELNGEVIFGTLPSRAKLVAYNESKPLTEIVRDVNKYSNNVMAQSVFLALSLPRQATLLKAAPVIFPASYERSQSIMSQWWAGKFPNSIPPVIENGSGLSRIESISAESLAQLLQDAWSSPFMPEFISSLPIASVDGTMRRSKATANAHIKTGSVRNVTTRAGYVLGTNAERRIFVFMINCEKAHETRDIIDTMIDWAADPR